MPNSSVITHIDNVNLEWLMSVLTQSGALTAGHVATFESIGGGGHWSQNARLTLTYSADAQGACPTALFLKLVNTDLGDGDFFLPSEVTYYTRDYVDLTDAPLVRCYDAVHDPTQNRYHLLLEDLSATHIPAYDLIPTLEYGYEIADGLAAMHAHWWGIDKLNSIGVQPHAKAHLRGWTAVGACGIGPVNAVFGNRLEPHWPALINEIFEKLPAQLVRRGADPTHFTLIHGDPNPGNILIPKEGVVPLFFIDQQPFDFSILTWSGLFDLAYVMALYWRSDLRRELEMPVLERYHGQLIDRGVTTYAWDMLLADYRLAVAMMVPLAIEYMCQGEDPDWNEFRYGLVQRTLTACDDLKITELLF